MVFLVLLLANALLLALNYVGNSGQENLPDGTEINPEKLRLLSGQRASAGAQTVSARGTKTQPRAQPCLVWGVFVEAELARIRAVVKELALGERLFEQSIRIPGQYWVYLPPTVDAAARQSKFAALKQLGVSGAYVVQDDNVWRNAISVGSFDSEEAAQTQLKALERQGIIEAEVARRSDHDKQTVLIVREPSDAISAKLHALKTGFPNTAIKPIICPP